MELGRMLSFTLAEFGLCRVIAPEMVAFLSNCVGN